MIHPFDDPYVISGQGTVGLEIIEEVNDIDVIVVPIGGGGLAASIAVALKDGHPGYTIPQRTVEIPVCYEDEFGPDLGRVLKHTGYDKEELIERHTSGRYLVYFLGFSAGFPYIGGMDESLATPRLKTPRKAVPAGSVGIAGQQTGMYPLPTPGGWNLIGRTPLPLFNRSNPKDTSIRMGDRIRFRTVGRAEFESLGQSQS